jgi:ribosomal protein S18 acetylase RimI-like enzyme
MLDAPEVTIRPARREDHDDLVRLIAHFRVALSELRDGKRKLNMAAAAAELADYTEDAAYPIYVAVLGDGEIAGYLVCRLADEIVWAESLYVDPARRRQGIASALYAQAECLAQELGSDTVYNWVHPNNDRIIAFLKKRGYDVLNLIEVRRTQAGESIGGEIQVGDHTFRY